MSTQSVTRDKARVWGLRLLGLTGVVVAVSLVWLLPGAQNDFIYDWLSAKAFISGIDPYQSIGDLAEWAGLASGQELSQIHPRIPASLVLQAPLGWIPFEHSYITGRLLTVGSAVFFAWVLSTMIAVRTPYALAVLPLVMLAWPLSTVLTYSQTGFLVAGLIGLTWLLDDRWLAGLPLAAAIALKLWPWLLIPALWVVGRKRAAYGAAIGFVGLNLVGMAFPHVTIDGLERMLSDALGFQSASLASEFGVPAWFAGMAGLAAILWIGRRTDHGYAIAIVVALLAAPFVWVHYLPALLIPVALLRSAEERRPALP